MIDVAPDYRNAFIAAIILHVVLAMGLWIEKSNTQPAFTKSEQKTSGLMDTQTAQDTPQAIQAVSVDQHEVMQAVNRLKQERAHQQTLENNHQRALKQQAENARAARIQEQQRLAQVQREAARLALMREKQMKDAQEHLKQLTILKQKEIQQLAAIKQQAAVLQKQQEAKKIAELKKKQLEEHARAEQLKMQKLKAQKELAAHQASVNAAKSAQMAGEVDKYKAMILSAIGRQWILPENADARLSSQFRIRLAPNGAVLDVSLIHSSGDPILDRSAQSAIYKASPLPVPHDLAAFNLFRDIRLTVRPVNARG